MSLADADGCSRSSRSRGRYLVDSIKLWLLVWTTVVGSVWDKFVMLGDVCV